MQIRQTRSGTYLIRATYDPATQKSPSKVIGKLGYEAAELNEGVTLTPDEQAQIDAHFAPLKLRQASLPIRHLKGRLTDFLEALKAVSDAETPELMKEHQALLKEALKALQSLSKSRRRKAKTHPPVEAAPLPFAAVPVSQEGRQVLPLPLVSS